MDEQVLKSSDLIDPLMGIHYAYHKSLNSITIKHTHDFYEFFLIIKGKVLHIINDKKETLLEGHLVFIRPSDIHNYEVVNGNDCELINLAFPQDTLIDLFNYYGEGFNSSFLLESKYPPTIMLSNAEKDSLFKKFESLNLIPRINKQIIKTQFKILINEIFNHYFNKPVIEDNKDLPGWLFHLKMEMNKKENFIAGLDKMIELSGKSQEHLNREIRKYLRITSTELVNQIRLNYASNMLTNSDMSIVEIALESGYENLSHFYHLFKKQYKTSPKEFRKTHKREVIP